MTTSAEPAVREMPEPPPAIQILQLVLGSFYAQSTFLAADLKIADLLKDGPQTVEYLAVATGSDERSLYRMLRMLASVGVFVEDESGRFANTPASDTLREDHPASTRAMARWLNHPDRWNVMGEMRHSIKTGETAWEHVTKEPVFQHLFETNTALGDVFNQAMTSFSAQTIPAILDNYDFSSAGTIADIGGGYGHLLGAVLKAYPDAKGVLFDLGHVLEGAPEMLKSYGVSDRVDVIEGDFNAEIPVVADVYMLKHIIHDWYDDTNQRILGNIRENMPEGAKVLILDGVVPEGNEPSFAKILDLEMLMVPGGMERTAKEFEALLNKSGFRLTRIIPTPSPISIIEAEKA